MVIAVSQAVLLPLGKFDRAGVSRANTSLWLPYQLVESYQIICDQTLHHAYDDTTEAFSSVSCISLGSKGADRTP